MWGRHRKACLESISPFNKTVYIRSAGHYRITIPKQNNYMLRSPTKPMDSRLLGSYTGLAPNKCLVLMGYRRVRERSILQSIKAATVRCLLLKVTFHRLKHTFRKILCRCTIDDSGIGA
ncbi:DNA polymerase epsilon subunit D [Fusarium oxysporum f. sp. albedinis]|nr:DNA polymerase epsilon subunit D [Fusarium oxysporum f. sp. albedinis]